MKKFAVIVAAGTGSRMQHPVPKQFIELKGRPVLWYTLNAFLKAYNDLQIILVLRAENMEHGFAIANTTCDPQRIKTAAGGDTRFQSVKNGLSLVQDDSIVFVHDAVRCLVSTELIHRCYEEAVQRGNAVPAIHATDSIRIDNGHGYQITDRNKVYLIQTPQTFKSDVLKKAFDRPHDESFTDEATVAEASGVKIHLVEGEAGNIKLTRPMDLLVAEVLLAAKL